MTGKQELDEENPLNYVRRRSRGRLNWKIRAVIYVVLAVVLVAAGGVATYKFLVPKEASITNDVVYRQLKEVQDLTTMTESDYGFITYKDGDAFYNKKQFTLFYSYEARAGFDLSKAKIEINDKTIDVTLPAPTILSVDLDPNKMRVFDESSSVLSHFSSKDTIKAQQEAKKQCEQKLNKSDLLKSANEHGEEVVEQILYGPLAKEAGYTVNVKVTEPKS